MYTAKKMTIVCIVMLVIYILYFAKYHYECLNNSQQIYNSVTKKFYFNSLILIKF